MILKKTALTLLIALLLTGCGTPLIAPAGMPVAIGNLPDLIVTIPPDATATPTPFQPIAPTPTYLPTMPTTPTATATPPPPNVPTALPRTPFPDWRKPGYFPPPSDGAWLPIPPPVGRLKQPDGQINILLLGSDFRPIWGEQFRTDTIMLMTINPAKERVSITSFPRDLYVYIPGWTMQRINTAFGHGGFETLAKTIEYNFGVRPDHYVLINFRSFIRIVNKLDGLDVKVSQTLSDYRGSQWFTIPEGVNHMNGKTALWYARSRKSTSDIDRNRRQQEVLQALIERLLTFDALTQADDLWQTYKDNVETNLKFSDILPFLPLAARMRDTSNIKHYYIGKGEITNWITPDGAMVLLPNREAIVDMMRQALKSK